MSSSLRNYKKGPEHVIQERIVAKLRKLDWSVKETHGNLYQYGVPDLFACHRVYGIRWIEVKDPKRRGDIFTPAQHVYFRELDSKRCGIWVLTSDSDDELAKLMQPANWRLYLKKDQLGEN